VDAYKQAEKYPNGEKYVERQIEGLVFSLVTGVAPVSSSSWAS